MILTRWTSTIILTAWSIDHDDDSITGNRAAPVSRASLTCCGAAARVFAEAAEKRTRAAMIS